MNKVTDEELQKLQSLRTSLFEIVSGIGELHLNKVFLERDLGLIATKLKEKEEQFYAFQKEERVLFSELTDKYGTGDIDVDTGEIAG